MHSICSDEKCPVNFVNNWMSAWKNAEVKDTSLVRSNFYEEMKSARCTFDENIGTLGNNAID